MSVKMSPRLALVIIAGMFILPLAVAWLMYVGVIDYQPATTRNLGTLVQPPRPVELQHLESVPAGDSPLSDLGEHWVVLHALPGQCDEPCTDTVTGLRQVHRATGREQSRIRLVLLLARTDQTDTAARLKAIYPAFQLAADPRGILWPELEQIATASPIPGRAAGSTYLIDPLGNIMMHYETGSDPNKLKKDLKRLLTWSKLDEQ